MNEDIIDKAVGKNTKTIIKVTAIGFSLFTLMLFMANYQSNRDFSVQKEVCYKGVTYVRFNEDKYAWGSIMYDINGNIVTCTNDDLSKL